MGKLRLREAKGLAQGYEPTEGARRETGAQVILGVGKEEDERRQVTGGGPGISTEIPEVVLGVVALRPHQSSLGSHQRSWHLVSGVRFISPGPFLSHGTGRFSLTPSPYFPKRLEMLWTQTW